MHKMFWMIAAMVFFLGNAAWPNENPYRFRSEPATSAIVLAIDCSGSMNGRAFEDAKAGALRFVERMHPSDRAAVVAFSDGVREVQGMTGNRTALRRAISGLRVGGRTKLYDAIAQSILRVMGQDGGRIVVFLTDGRDTGSRCTAEELRKIGASEGLFVYGIGLGDVDQDALSALSAATGGTFEIASQSSDLLDLYPRILAEYYRKYGDLLDTTGALSVRSLPDGRTVLVNAREEGLSPAKLDALTPGTYQVQVFFEHGTWEYEIPVKLGQRTIVDARESDLGAELVIASRPSNASVFLDGTYMGMTAIAPFRVKPGGKGWVQAALEDGRPLRMDRVPYGVHRLKFRAMSDFDFGSNQEFEVEIQVGDPQMAVYVEILGTARSPYVLDSAGTARIVGGAKKDPFDELDDF
ncbi:MAG: VWA domain-containing protein [Candidatus Latescibacterota bacterium]